MREEVQVSAGNSPQLDTIAFVSELERPRVGAAGYLERWQLERLNPRRKKRLIS